MSIKTKMGSLGVGSLNPYIGGLLNYPTYHPVYTPGLNGVNYPNYFFPFDS